jgi:mono/diheme cytochrome c family protein
VLVASLGAAACNIGGGGGGGPADKPFDPRPSAKSMVSADPLARGAEVYGREGCRLCHGDAGKGGVENANSETAGKINGLTLVKEGYSKEELIDKIREGQHEVGKDKKDGPTPPLRMPKYGEWLTDQELSDLAAYLLSLYPKDRSVDDEEEDEKDDEEDTGDKDEAAAAADAKAKPVKAGKP